MLFISYYQIDWLIDWLYLREKKIFITFPIISSSEGVKWVKWVNEWVSEWVSEVSEWVKWVKWVKWVSEVSEVSEWSEWVNEYGFYFTLIEISHPTILLLLLIVTNLVVLFDGDEYLVLFFTILYCIVLYCICAICAICIP